MKRLLTIAIVALFIFTGCKKTDTPSGTNDGVKITLTKGDNQSGLFGELLKDSIILKISSPNPANRFKIEGRMIQGNGLLEAGGYLAPAYLYLDSAGKVGVQWRMGCDNISQKVRFYVYTDTVGYNFNSVPSDSITVSATASKPSGWCRACGYGMINVYAPKIVTADNNTLYLVNNGLFNSTDGGLNWYKIKNLPYSDEVMDLQFNSRKEAYVLTKEHGVYFSTDMKQWTEINTGLLDKRDPTGFFVDDSTLLVSFYFDGPYITKNNGAFWKKVVVSSFSQRYYFFNRHPDGRLMLFDDWSDFKVSADNGDTWTNVFLDYKYRNYQIYDFKIDKSGMLYIGSGDATLAIVDPYTYQGSLHNYYQWNSSLQIINNISFLGNDVYYLVNYNPVPGIYKQSSGYGIWDVGFSEPIYYYFLKSNGVPLVSTRQWVYFKQ